MRLTQLAYFVFIVRAVLGLSLRSPKNPSSSAPSPFDDIQNVESVSSREERPLCSRTAVVLNTNARLVTPDLEPLATKVFGSENVFLTSTEDDARKAADKIAQNLDTYNTIVPLGGDGTLASMINFLCQSIGGDTDEALSKLPLIAYVPLGTGNGVGSVVGCRIGSNGILGLKRRKKRNLERVFRRLASVDSRDNDDFEIVELPMVEVTLPDDKSNPVSGDLCFFAGVGFDSLMLNDFKTIKKWSQRTKILSGFLGSVGGYCVALMVRTLPKCVARGAHKVRVEIKSSDPECVWVDHRRGDVVRPCADPVLYRGTAGIVAGGTSPFYGGGLRLFPFARMTRDKMHIRVGRIHPLRGFVNIPRIFSGSYRDKSENFGCLDFIGNDFDVKVEPMRSVGERRQPSTGYPLQHSGESVGNVSRLRLRVTPTPVRFISLTKCRPVESDDQ